MGKYQQVLIWYHWRCLTRRVGGLTRAHAFEQDNIISLLTIGNQANLGVGRQGNLWRWRDFGLAYILNKVAKPFRDRRLVLGGDGAVPQFCYAWNRIKMVHSSFREHRNTNPITYFKKQTRPWYTNTGAREMEMIGTIIEKQKYLPHFMLTKMGTLLHWSAMPR